MRLNGKVIFIVSYENWGNMLMSKHHYAIELGKAGNKVYFINHPDKRKELRRGEIKVSTTTAPNVSVVTHRLFHPYFLKFKFTPLYYFLTSFHIRRIIRVIGSKPDLVWSFDTGNTLPLRYFPDSAVKLYMPVDGPFGHEDEKRAARQSDIIISVTDHILNEYKIFGKPGFIINHGVAEVFLNGAETEERSQRLRVGYSGSLIRNDLDTNCFLTIIKKHPEITFEFWGEHDFRKSNIHLPQDVDAETLDFLNTLRTLPNVVMHGPVSPDVLAKGLKRMDALLICYRIQNDPNNHHKVLEYLGTGKVIVSSYMKPYVNRDPDLVSMVQSNRDNEGLPQLFDSVINNLEFHNNPEKREKRKKFASQYSYSRNVKKIDEFISANGFDKLYQQS